MYDGSQVLHLSIKKRDGCVVSVLSQMANLRASVIMLPRLCVCDGNTSQYAVLFYFLLCITSTTFLWHSHENEHTAGLCIRVNLF